MAIVVVSSDNQIKLSHILKFLREMLTPSAFIQLTWLLQSNSFLCVRISNHQSFYLVFHPSYVYWTVHHLDSWIKRDQLDDTCFIVSLFTAQHVLDVLTSETCWAVNNETIKQVTSSWSLFIQLIHPYFPSCTLVSAPKIRTLHNITYPHIFL